MVYPPLPPNTIKEHFTQILLGLKNICHLLLGLRIWRKVRSETGIDCMSFLPLITLFLYLVVPLIEALCFNSIWNFHFSKKKVCKIDLSPPLIYPGRIRVKILFPLVISAWRARCLTRSRNRRSGARRPSLPNRRCTPGPSTPFSLSPPPRRSANPSELLGQCK